MKILYIVRHAKSSWEYDGINDIDRPLKKRGIEDAYLISKVLQKKIETPSVFI
jgi:phosphohistidine phosphatase